MNTIGAESFQHIHEKLAEIWVSLETMKAFLRAAEADATLDEWGVMRPAWNPLDAARNLFPAPLSAHGRDHPTDRRLGLVAMPTEQDLKGPLVEDIRKYYQAARAEAFDRIPLFRLAWDASMSAFASRQVLVRTLFLRRSRAYGGGTRDRPRRRSRRRAESVRVREGGPR